MNDLTRLAAVRLDVPRLDVPRLKEEIVLRGLPFLFPWMRLSEASALVNGVRQASVRVVGDASVELVVPALEAVHCEHAQLDWPDLHVRLVRDAYSSSLTT